MYSGRIPDLLYKHCNRNDIQLIGKESNDSGGLNLSGGGNSGAINEIDER